MRLWSRARSFALVLAMVAGLALASPVAAVGGYQSVARESSEGPYYEGVYTDFYYNPVNQGGTNCGNPSPTSTTVDFPVFDQARLIGPSGYVFIRLRDTCGGLAYWEYGFGYSGGETAVAQQLVYLSSGWHSMALWRPFSIGFGGGNGSNSRFYFSIDQVTQNAGLTWSAQFSSIEVGVESHAAEPATIVGRQTFSNMQWMLASYNDWRAWYGEDSRTISTYMCGKWGSNTSWYGGTSGSCPF